MFSGRHVQISQTLFCLIRLQSSLLQFLYETRLQVGKTVRFKAELLILKFGVVVKIFKLYKQYDYQEKIQNFCFQ